MDTHTFIWWDSDPAKLSPTASAFMQDPTNLIFLSIVSVWEITIKQQLGKLTLRMPLATIVRQQQSNGILILQPTLEHAFAVEALPTPHKDPFDRLLIAQANVENAAMLTADPLFSQYPVTIVW